MKNKKKKTHTLSEAMTAVVEEKEQERAGERERGEWKSCWCASLTAVSGRSTCALKRRHRADDDDDNGATTNRARQPITTRYRIRIKITIEVAIGIYCYLCLILSGSWATCPKRTRSSFNREFDKDENIIIMWIAEWIPSECVCVPTSSVECCWMVCAKRIEALPRSRRRIQANAVEFQLKTQNLFLIYV